MVSNNIKECVLKLNTKETSVGSLSNALTSTWAEVGYRSLKIMHEKMVEWKIMTDETRQFTAEWRQWIQSFLNW